MATATEKLFTNIPQLKDEKDWPVWKFQVTHALKAAEQWEFAVGTADDQRRDYESKKQKAFYSILQCIGQKNIPAVMKCKTPKELWDTLCELFERKTVSNKVYTLMQLYGMRMRKGTRIQDHLRQLDEISDQLSALEADVSELNRVAILLRSVQESYPTLVTALLARGDEELTLTFVKQALLDEEQRRGKGEDKQSDTALKASRRKSHHKSPACYNCGRVGHFMKDCRNGKPSTSKQHSTHHPQKPKSKHYADKAEEKKESSPDAQMFIANEAMRADVIEDEWIIDSGASRHMTFQRNMLYRFKKFNTPEFVGLGDGHTVEAIGTGDVKIVSQLPRNRKVIVWMTNVLYVPQLTGNLFSVRAATSNGNLISFGRNCWIRDGKRRLIGTGSPMGKLYKLNGYAIKSVDATANVADETESNERINLWHKRLAHVNIQQLRQLATHAEGIDLPPNGKQSFCEACIQGKMHKLPHHPLGDVRSKERLQLVHTDVCGPMQTQSIGGSTCRYLITFIDDHSRFCRTYFMKHKSEAIEKFKEFKAVAEKESGMTIKALRSDQGGEYMSEEFKIYLGEWGIRSESTAAYSPQQNGVAERLNRTLGEAARSMLLQANLSNMYWAEAVSTATYLRNRMVTSALKSKMTPYEMWFGKKPDLRHLRVFGCAVYAHIPDGSRRKLEKKAEKFRFIGYTETTGNYKVWDEVRQKCFIRHDLIFNEADLKSNSHTSSNEESQQDVEISLDVSPQEEVEEEEQAQPLQEPRRSERRRRPTIRYGLDDYADTANHCAFKSAKVDEPNTIQEALGGRHSKEWKEAADSEYSSLLENNTWELTELPKGRRAIGCKWVFRVKYDGQGGVERYKGRLVAQGFSQQYGIDYKETFSPVARYSSIRTILAYAVEHNMLVHQMDVVTAFLNGEIQEDIYMEQPPGYTQPGKENLVCKLKKSIYGLKQSPRCWNKKFTDHIKTLGFTESNADPCVFVRVNK